MARNEGVSIRGRLTSVLIEMPITVRAVQQLLIIFGRCVMANAENWPLDGALKRRKFSHAEKE